VYRKATLCIHPDKVQQKGANLQQKYIAEKVFDLLKVRLPFNIPGIATSLSQQYAAVIHLYFPLCHGEYLLTHKRPCCYQCVIFV
jgi:hypothetical protein